MQQETNFKVSITDKFDLLLDMSINPQKAERTVLLFPQLIQVVEVMPEAMWEKLQEARHKGQPTIKVATPQHLQALEKLN